MAEHAASISTEETPAAEATADWVPAAHPENPFTREDIAQFDADDVAAGKSLGVMLSWFFVYTIVVMTGAALWTMAKIM